jgi:hypothetical protein
MPMRMAEAAGGYTRCPATPHRPPLAYGDQACQINGRRSAHEHHPPTGRPNALTAALHAPWRHDRRKATCCAMCSSGVRASVRSVRGGGDVAFVATAPGLIETMREGVSGRYRITPDDYDTCRRKCAGGPHG